MGYVVSLGLQNSSYFLNFFLNLVASMAASYMHKLENKSLWKKEMSYGGDTWFMH